MTFKRFKISALVLLFTTAVSAQKYNKKFSENFNTNKDVVVNINASNAEIDVATWNKNEVSVEAVIEVEGLEKKEAEKYLKNWGFEALGNKSKVQISANKNRFHSIGNDNIVYFNSSGNNFPKIYELHNDNDDDIIIIPEVDNIEIPDVVIPEINFEEITFGKALEDFDFDKYAKDGGSYFFSWQDGANDITIKSKKEWEKFKKSKKYKKLKKKLKEESNRLNRERKRELLKAKKEALVRKKELKEKARKRERDLRLMVIESKRNKLLKKMGKNPSSYSYSYSTEGNDFTINGKKIKVTKKIVIKVPKNATFDLNTRHCKVKLPKTKASGKVSYGTFKADVLNGGKLNVSYSPVTINSLNACTLFLNNVTDAHVASVANTTLDTNSSGVIVDNIYDNVELINKFGELTIKKIHSNHNNFKVYLNYSSAGINVLDMQGELKFDVSDNMRTLKNGDLKFNGDFIITSKNKTLEVKGKYSQLTLKKQ
ncbi:MULTISPECIES: hypothetical protein [unclassified Tenacibaculum]|uniref:hypothetical protein n=1 Tax=unclassified Tenacibaculum TaxID=2635139 RepID=UPI001F240233|nr:MULTISPECIES: hypothetical protein [unclassified Tenacibaculum]MCF2876380.1 hypothetical protein [Tenacibaculum sp. Cn5-1]MCF2936477.1 hypothetical protein [Tenacibaculum sp. Cn5-34]MCG7512798.1 hypothetical protein [Tenacibaculum sp. Cn5-46]